MSLTNSKYYKVRKKDPNQWREFTISEGNMTDLIASFLQSTTHIPNAENVEKVIIGDLHKGQYLVSVAFKKGKEVK